MYQNNNSQISNPVQNVNIPNINENKVDNNIQKSTTELIKDFNKFQRENIDKLNAYL